MVEVDASLPAGAVVLAALALDRKKDGQWGKPKELRLTRDTLMRLADGPDRDLLARLAAAFPAYYAYATWQGDYQLPARFQIPHPLCGMLMPRLAATGRCKLRMERGAADLFDLEWDEGGTWRFELELAPAEGGNWTVQGALRRGEERMDVRTPALLLAGGLVSTRERIAPLDDGGAFPWIRFLRHSGVIQAADAQKQELLAALLEHPVAPPLVVPETLRYEEVCLTPRPCLKIHSPELYGYRRDVLRADLEFAYEGRRVPQTATSRGSYDPEARRFTLRDQGAEAGAVARMRELGFQSAAPQYPSTRAGWQLSSKKLPQAVRALVQAGWEIEAEGKSFRRSGAFRLEVTSGVDWFELRGEVDYQGTAVRLPQLLEALRRGENMVRLDDGSYGLLPEEWLGKIGLLVEMGAPARQGVRYGRHLLAHALRPFILRRTKEQVARELPPKTEQTIYCEMEPVQRRLYDELRQHYRETLLGRIQPQELGRSKIQVLEALLRLRQAACHPGLLDRQRLEEPSAKLEVLLDHLSEVVEEGHKALVFSQFTSLLAIVRRRLEKAGLVYEHLDGATRDRQARIERFQNDAACPLFLLSLKAGGLGLNLTAAEYVYLLDPWWNPAVEAQAMDRAHRIGQTRPVFAYRLIARDTVEEKVLELQNTKRDLAEAIISADRSLIRDLRREDLELLLS